MSMAQGRVQEEAAARVQAMALEGMRETGEDLARLMESTEIITDPSVGNYVDMYA